MLRRMLIGLLLGVSVLWAVFLAAIHLLYSSRLPSAPDSRTGHIYRMVVNHGYVRFGTDRESRILRVMENGLPIAGIVFASASLLGLWLGVFHIRGETPHAMNLPSHPQDEKRQ